MIHDFAVARDLRSKLRYPFSSAFCVSIICFSNPFRFQKRMALSVAIAFKTFFGVASILSFLFLCLVSMRFFHWRVIFAGAYDVTVADLPIPRRLRCYKDAIADKEEKAVVELL